MDDLPAITRGLAEMRRLGIKPIPFHSPPTEPADVVRSHEVTVFEGEQIGNPLDLGSRELGAVCGGVQTEPNEDTE